MILSAPSGSGKTTLMRRALARGFRLEFSISATSRAPRGKEVDGVDYHFLSPEVFREKIDQGEFLEWEMVYTDTYYGTLRSEVYRIWASGADVIFDIDVVGGLNLKRQFGPRALALFIQPPSLDALRARLEGRGTDAPEKIQERLAKAEKELARAPEFDRIITNDDLATAEAELVEVLTNFLGS